MLRRPLRPYFERNFGAGSRWQASFRSRPLFRLVPTTGPPAASDDLLQFARTRSKTLHGSALFGFIVSSSLKTQSITSAGATSFRRSLPNEFKKITHSNPARFHPTIFASLMLLEAIVFCARPEVALEGVKQTLFDHNCSLLRRLLRCMSHSATQPDSIALEMSKQRLDSSDEDAKPWLDGHGCQSCIVRGAGDPIPRISQCGCRALRLCGDSRGDANV